jgi:hypothetical protein
MTRCSAPAPSRARRLPAAALVAALALAGCGGGGGGEGIDLQSLPVFVDGAVTKGAVSGARVCGVWIVGGVQEAQTETCATTGADGAYSLQMPRRSGLLGVTATGGTWRDEATGAPATLRSLRSAVPFDGSGNNVTAQVTALTEIMMQRAQARGAIEPATVAAATAEVERTFGVSGLTRTRPADVTLRDANLSGTGLQYGLANAGVTGWMVERGVTTLEEALGTLASRIGDGTLYEDLPFYRAGMRRVITANPASGLNLNASAYAALVALDFGRPPPQPSRPTVVEQSGTQRFAVRWPLDDLFARPVGMVCVTNVPASVPVATVRAAMDAHAANYGTAVSAMTPIERCVAGGQSITLDWSQTGADPWGAAIWGDEG